MKKNIKGLIVVLLLTFSFSGNLFADESAINTGDLTQHSEEQPEKNILGDFYFETEMDLNSSDAEFVSYKPEFSMPDNEIDTATIILGTSSMLVGCILNQMSDVNYARSFETYHENLE